MYEVDSQDGDVHGMVRDTLVNLIACSIDVWSINIDTVNIDHLCGRP